MKDVVKSAVLRWKIIVIIKINYGSNRLRRHMGIKGLTLLLMINFEYIITVYIIITILIIII